jgi:UDP-glucose 4-epimerase
MPAAASVGGLTVLVTGATGFIGRHLTERLVVAGAAVHAVTRGLAADRAAGPTWHAVDLEEWEPARDLVSTVRPDLVYHLAGYVSGIRDASAVLPSLRGNLLSTVHLLSAVNEQGRGRFVLAASLEEPEADAGWPVPSSPYAASKYAASTYTRMFHSLYGTQVALLRTFIVYGPGQADEKKVIPYVTRSLLRGEVPELSSGTRPVDWVYVEDVVDALLASAGAPNIAGRTVDVGSGALTTVRGVVEELVTIIRPECEPLFGVRPDRPMERVCCARLEDAKAALGWSPRTSLREGLRRTVEWHREELRR